MITDPPSLGKQLAFGETGAILTVRLFVGRASGVESVEDNSKAVPPLDNQIAWTLLNTLVGALGLVRPDGTLVFANETVTRWYGQPLAALQGTSVWEIFPPEKRIHRKIILHRVIETGTPIRFIDRFEDRWIELLFHPLGAREQIEYVAIYARDITRQIEAEENLKRLALQIITIQEDERRRISQDLHDDIGQSMTALILSLKAIEGKLASGDEDIGDQIKGALRNVETLVRQTRLVFYQLRPPALEALPLPKAVETFCASFAQFTGLTIDFSSLADLPFIPPLQATALYRLAQEGLNNVAKHAQASAVWVNLDYADGEVSVSIEDNGQGFDSEKLGAGMGLQGIRDRFVMLGGSLEVESVPGKGTRVYGALPLAITGET